MTKLESNQLFQSIKATIEQARQYVVQNVNTAMVFTYYHIGKAIVEDEQNGRERASYASETLKTLSLRLAQEFGKGYSVDNLEKMRAFFLEYRISETVS